VPDCNLLHHVCLTRIKSLQWINTVVAVIYALANRH
jgi:hypothetical protein